MAAPRWRCSRCLSYDPRSAKRVLDDGSPACNTCFQALRKDVDSLLYTARSRVAIRGCEKRAGLGLFTRRPIKRNRHITKFHGTLSVEPIHGAYVVHLERNLWLDASVDVQKKRDPSALAQFANQAPDESAKNARIGASRREKHASLIAVRDIRAGEEILTTYGNKYYGLRSSFLVDEATPPRTFGPHKKRKQPVRECRKVTRTPCSP